MINLNTRIPSVQGQQFQIASPGLPNSQNNIYLFGNRKPLDTPNSGTVTFGAASHVDVITLAAKNQAIVYYSEGATLVNPLLSVEVSGTFDDSTATVTGTFVSAAVGSFVVSSVTYDSYIILQATAFATITTGDIIAVTYANMGLPILKPQSGFPMYQYYNCYQLPTQYLNDAAGTLEYFVSCGFTVQTGYSATETLLGSAHVDTTTLASQSKVIVYFTSSASLIQPLVGAGISGTFNDTTASITGAFISATVATTVISSVTYDSYIILQSNGFASVAAADVLQISFVNSNLLVPDANYTEPFIMNIYQGIAASLIPLNQNSTVATPNVYFSFLPNATDSGLFGPTSNALTLTVPTVVSGSVVTFAIPSLNVAYIPLSALGNTTITQATSLAVGTVVSAVVNGGVLNVTLSNVTGTFNTTNLCTLQLDALQTIFTFQQKLFAYKKISLQQFSLPYQINTNTDITTTYKPAFDYVATLNLPAATQNGQGVCFICFANLTIPVNTAVMSLPSNVNNYQFEPIYYPYNPSIGELPCSAGQLSAAFAMVIGSNVSPLNPQGGVIINGLPTSANNNTYIDVSISGPADSILQIGWNVIAVNNNTQAYVINPITGQITFPGLPTPDRENYPIYVWQTVDYLKLGLYLICSTIGLGQVRQNTTILTKLKSNIIAFMLTMQNAGMLLNVIQNQAFVTIVQDPNNPLGVDIVIPMQIIPGLENIFYTINIFSSTVNLQQAA